MTVSASVRRGQGWAKKTPNERLNAHSVFDPETGCCNWTGRLTHNGYGRLGRCLVDGQVHDTAHRVAYALSNGPIPSGMQVDHICKNRRCCSPLHLRLVSPSQNVLENSVGLAARNLMKTHCRHGHEFTPENTRLRNHDGKVRRQCRACNRLRMSKKGLGVP